MPPDLPGTGACGINCLACRLAAAGVCSPCGSGASAQGLKKLAAQLDAFGGFCPVLKCAVDHRVGYCLRDCRRFPCEHFRSGPYPYAQGYLDMQVRRRKDLSEKDEQD